MGAHMRTLLTRTSLRVTVRRSIVATTLVTLLAVLPHATAQDMDLTGEFWRPVVDTLAMQDDEVRW